jgi:hypothetical protein
MRKTLLLTFAVTTLFSATAIAQPAATVADRTSFDLTPNAVQQMLALLQPEKTCTLTGFTFGTIAPYNLDDLSVVILVYSVEGCGGGNNWHSAIAAFDIKQSDKTISAIRLHRFSPDLERAMTVAGVNTINFIKADIGSQSVMIDTLDWGTDDAHCCPGDGRQLKFWIDKGVLKAAVTKRWREPRR